MSACNNWNVELDILVYENEMFSLPDSFVLTIDMLLKVENLLEVEYVMQSINTQQQTINTW